MCEHCRNIQIWRKFDAPKDYLACIAYIQQLVGQGEFELIAEESTCPLEIAVPKLEDALTSMGLSNVKVEQTPVQFAGLVREGAVISGEMDGVPMYETLVCIKQEGYMCCVTMCSWTEDITADLTELFYQA